jgi:hypothetical protein
LAGWPEVLWDWEMFYEPPPEPNSPVGQRLLRAGLPREFLDEEWWAKANNGAGDLPRYLQMEPREPKTPRRVQREEQRRWRAEQEQRRAEAEAQGWRSRVGRGGGVIA